MELNLQPTLTNKLVTLLPLTLEDFEALYAVAADPLIWEQHPNFDRYKRDVFRHFFDGAIASKAAFKIIDNATHHIIGSSRYYDLNKEENSVAVGYTFIARRFWGKGYNEAIKQLLFDHAFQALDQVVLHIGGTNYRSQKATMKLSACKIKEELAEINGTSQLKFTYQVSKEAWINRQIAGTSDEA